MPTSESFEHDGPWIRSSEGFAVRALGRSGMEYVRGSETLTLDAEAGATGFTLWLPLRTVPDDLRELVLDDVTRAWQWAGFTVETIGS